MNADLHHNYHDRDHWAHQIPGSSRNGSDVDVKKFQMYLEESTEQALGGFACYIIRTFEEGGAYFFLTSSRSGVPVN